MARLRQRRGAGRKDVHDRRLQRALRGGGTGNRKGRSRLLFPAAREYAPFRGKEGSKRAVLDHGGSFMPGATGRLRQLWERVRTRDPYWDDFLHRPPADPHNVITPAILEAPGGSSFPNITD